MSRCPMIWDGALCWNSSSPGTINIQDCPAYVFGFDHSRECHPFFSSLRWFHHCLCCFIIFGFLESASKYCQSDGSWEIHKETKESWTNYTACTFPSEVPPEDSSFEVSTFKGRVSSKCLPGMKIASHRTRSQSAPEPTEVRVTVEDQTRVFPWHYFLLFAFNREIDSLIFYQSFSFFLSSQTVFHILFPDVWWSQMAFHFNSDINPYLFLKSLWRSVHSILKGFNFILVNSHSCLVRNQKWEERSLHNLFCCLKMKMKNSLDIFLVKNHLVSLLQTSILLEIYSFSWKRLKSRSALSLLPVLCRLNFIWSS